LQKSGIFFIGFVDMIGQRKPSILPACAILAAAGPATGSVPLFLLRILPDEPALEQHPAGTQADQAKQGKRVYQHF
jgi:hypothetical protein